MAAVDSFHAEPRGVQIEGRPIPSTQQAIGGDSSDEMRLAVSEADLQPRTDGREVRLFLTRSLRRVFRGRSFHTLLPKKATPLLTEGCGADVSVGGIPNDAGATLGVILGYRLMHSFAASARNPSLRVRCGFLRS